VIDVLPPQRRIAQRVLDDIDELLPRMGATYQAEISGYARLAPEQLADEVLQTSRSFIEGYFGRLARGEDPSLAQLPDLAGAGRRRLEMGIALDGALRAFRIAGRDTWRAVVDAVEPGEEAVLADLAAGWIDHLDRASCAFVEGYLDASHARLRRLDGHRSVLLDALLEAESWGEVAAVAAEHALALVPHYRPVLLAGEDVVVRIDLLLEEAPAGTVVGPRGDRVLALLADTDAEPRRLAKAARASVTAYGREVAPGRDLRDEVSHLEATLDTVLNAGHLEGVFGPDELILEQLLTGVERGAAALGVRILAPLVSADPDGHLLAALRTYLATGSVTDTAVAHGVNANKAAHWLRRIRDLTGLDPRIPSEAALLVIALTLGVGQGDGAGAAAAERRPSHHTNTPTGTPRDTPRESPRERNP
jgi:hypothetical protein